MNTESNEELICNRKNVSVDKFSAGAASAHRAAHDLNVNEDEDEPILEWNQSFVYGRKIFGLFAGTAALGIRATDFSTASLGSDRLLRTLPFVSAPVPP